MFLKLWLPYYDTALIQKFQFFQKCINYDLSFTVHWCVLCLLNLLWKSGIKIKCFNLFLAQWSVTYCIAQMNAKHRFSLISSTFAVTADQNDQNTETIALPNNAQTVQTVYPVQYIDASDPTIYTTGNGQM